MLLYFAMIREFERLRACCGLYPCVTSSSRQLGVGETAGTRDRSLANRIHVFSVVCGLCLVLCFVKPLQASDFIDVAVNGQDDNEKQNAYQVAMRWLLQRQGNGATLSGNEAVREALRNAERYVDEFEFRVAAEGEGVDAGIPVTSKVRETGQVTHILRVALSTEALSGLLADQVPDAEAEQDAAPAEVKRALVWLLVQDAGRDIMVGPDNAANVVGRVRELAGGLGWNLYFPALDTEDLALLGPNDLSEENIEAIERASERYQQQTVLSAVLSRDVTGRWKADWLRLPLTVNALGGESSSSTEESAVAVRRLSVEPAVANLDQLLQQGIAWLTGGIDDLGRPVRSGSPTAGSVAEQDSSGQADAALVAGSEAPAPQNPPFGSSGSSLGGEDALIWIGGVESSRIYSRSLKLFQSIAAVETVQPRDLRREGILFVVSPRSAIEAIAKAARASSWLRTTQSAALQAGDAAATQSGWQNKSFRADLYLELLQ